eukprot:8564299-Pyramimonas_sp.AAC.1
MGPALCPRQFSDTCNSCVAQWWEGERNDPKQQLRDAINPADGATYDRAINAFMGDITRPRNFAA